MHFARNVNDWEQLGYSQRNFTALNIAVSARNWQLSDVKYKVVNFNAKSHGTRG